MQLILITFVTEKIFYFKTKCFHDIAKHSGENTDAKYYIWTMKMLISFHSLDS